MFSRRICDKPKAPLNSGICVFRRIVPNLCQLNSCWLTHKRCLNQIPMKHHRQFPCFRAAPRLGTGLVGTGLARCETKLHMNHATFIIPGFGCFGTKSFRPYMWNAGKMNMQVKMQLRKVKSTCSLNMGKKIS